MLFSVFLAGFLEISLCMLLAQAKNGTTSTTSTTLCYQFNHTICEQAKASKNVSRINIFCSPQLLPCPVPDSGHAACLTVWKQRINDTLPEHTDNTWNSTAFMTCYPVIKHANAKCAESCVATEVGPVNLAEGTAMVSCCCTQSSCNNYSLRTINITVKSDDNTNTSEATKVYSKRHIITGLIIAGVIGLVGSVLIIMVTAYMRRKRKRLKHSEDELPLEQTDVTEEASLADAGLTLQTEIAQGRYATVHHAGEIDGVKVAIKCFTAAHRRMWQQERDIYRMPGMKDNRNLATFYGATQSGSGNDLTMWLVLEYYPHGSIYDYLKGHIITWPIMLKLAHSMMNGLSYLHDELILANGQRRSLAHRDIKSKNILIKNDMTAAIADFGLAQCFMDGHVNETGAQFQAGTHRYMAPEVLDGAISFTKDAFLRIDVYAAALVLWELLTRCEVSENRSTEYRAPYEDMESGRYYSLLETLQVVVSKEKKRPSFPDCLYRHTHTASLITTIEESWDADAEARLSAGCIESRLADLMRRDDSTELNNIRNLEPPPYSNGLQVQVDGGPDSLLINY